MFIDYNKVTIIKRIITRTIDNLATLMDDKDNLEKILQASSRIVKSLKKGNKLMICGNGGSAADAQHIAGEFLCRFYKDREPLPAIALTTDTSVLTSISNDYSYDHIIQSSGKSVWKKWRCTSRHQYKRNFGKCFGSIQDRASDRNKDRASHRFHGKDHCST